MSTNPEAVATATVVTRAHAAREAQGTNQTDFNNRSSQNDLQSSIATIQQQLIELEIETTSLTERRDAASHGQLIQPHERGGSLHTPPHQQPMHASTPSDALHLMELRAARAEATLNASRLLTSVLVATSTCEAELISLCSASLTTVYLHRLLESFGIHQQGPTVIEEDNQPAIAVAESDMQSQRTRHIARRYFKVRELINGTGHGTAEYDAPSIRVRYVRSEKNLSDAFTKPLPEVTLLRLRSQLLKPRNF